MDMVNTRSNKEQKTKEKVTAEPTISAKETNLETPYQSIDDGINTHAKRRRTREENNRVVTNRQCRRNNKQHTGNDKRRFSNKKNVVNREDCSDGRNETKRERGSNTSD